MYKNLIKNQLDCSRKENHPTHNQNIKSTNKERMLNSQGKKKPGNIQSRPTTEILKGRRGWIDILKPLKNTTDVNLANVSITIDGEN